jgi:hypothetical protein
VSVAAETRRIAIIVAVTLAIGMFFTDDLLVKEVGVYLMERQDWCTPRGTPRLLVSAEA